MRPNRTVEGVLCQVLQHRVNDGKKIGNVVNVFFFVSGILPIDRLHLLFVLPLAFLVETFHRCVSLRH